MRRERQIFESKEIILEALQRLIKEYSLQDITMTMISQEACVSRMTVYRHFKDKESILLYAVNVRMNELAADIDSKENLRIYDILLFRFKLLRESPFTKTLYESDQLERLFNTIRESGIQKFDLLSSYDIDPMLIRFIGGGIDAVTASWIDDDMKVSDEVMAEKLMRFIKALFERNQLLE